MRSRNVGCVMEPRYGELFGPIPQDTSDRHMRLMESGLARDYAHAYAFGNLRVCKPVYVT